MRGFASLSGIFMEFISKKKCAAMWKEDFFLARVPGTSLFQSQTLMGVCAMSGGVYV